MAERTIPQRELRNNIAAVLRAAEAGESFTVTVHGRPVARLVPPGQPGRPRIEVDRATIARILALPADPALAGELDAAEAPAVCDYLLWYARDIEQVKYQPLYLDKKPGSEGATNYNRVLLPDGSRRSLSRSETLDPSSLPTGARIYSLDNLTSQSIGRQKGEGAASWFPVELDGQTYRPSLQVRWKTNETGMKRLQAAGRLEASASRLGYVRYFDDFPVFSLDNNWADVGSSFMADKLYVVQTTQRVVQRCMLMTSSPGDLVLDPTCGSGTTAYVAEQWGRRWITIDTSRVPLALARQRLLTATFPYYELQDPGRGPASGFVYKRRQNARGEEVGGIVPHVTLKSIAQGEPPAEEVLVDRPEVDSKITRVSGPFVVEATIPRPVDYEGDGIEDSGALDDAGYLDRMLETLRRNPILQLAGNQTIELRNVRPPATALTLSAEAALAPDDAPVGIVFGPENGPVSERLVFEAAREAHARSYEQLLVIGFAIEAAARELVEKAESLVGIPATYVQATPDLVMGDLLKTLRSSQIFSVAGLPDVAIEGLPPEEPGGPERFQVELRGLDVFDPVTMEVDHREGSDVPAWLLDTDYNGMCFHVSQAFFPRTSAWDGLRRALRGEFEDSVWAHLAGTTSAPFAAGEQGAVAVKVIDDRGNELLVEKSLDEVR